MSSGIPCDFTLPNAQKFFEKLIALGKSCRFDPDDFIAVAAGECDFISCRNKYGYEGITQIGTSELANLGYHSGSRGEFWRQSLEVQVEYSAKYFEYWRTRLNMIRYESPGHLWAANLAPARLNNSDGVVFDAKLHPKSYKANAWLDRYGGKADGVIDRDDLDAAIVVAIKRNQKTYDLAIKNLNIVKMQLALKERREPTEIEKGYDLTDPWLSEITFAEKIDDGRNVT